jgi:hypothetical protein
MRYSMGIAGLLTAWAVLAPSAALSQNLPPQSLEAATNKKLRIQLDRESSHAFEPVFLCITAEQFATPDDAEVQISRSGGEWQSLEIKKKDWTRTQINIPGKPATQRRGVILQAVENGGARRWLFSAAGKYSLRVKVGPDSTTLTLEVSPPEVGEALAWTALGDRVEDILQNNFADQPEQATIDLSAQVIRKYPRTLCAAYCQSYLSITQFKVLFEKNGRSGGAGVYGSVADNLTKIADGFKEGFFGEMTAFYAGYARGLTSDFPGLLAITNNMKTHLTLWGDGVTDMRLEVLSHLAPRVIPVDPAHPEATTNPTSRPYVIPIARP